MPLDANNNWTSGLVAPAAAIATLSIGETEHAVQALDQSVTSSVSAVQITDLEFEMEVNRKYLIRALVIFGLGDAVSGYKFSMTGPLSPVSVTLFSRVTEGGSPAPVSAEYIADYNGVTGPLPGGVHFWEVEGIIENGENGGPFYLRFAQNTSDAGAITVIAGSYLKITRIG